MLRNCLVLILILTISRSSVGATTRARPLSEVQSSSLQDKFVVESANFYFNEVNAAAARTSSTKSPLILGLRLILEATKSCTDREESCVYKMLLNASGSDNRVRNIEAEVWRKQSGKMEILSSREVPLDRRSAPNDAFPESLYEAAVEFYINEVNTASRTLTPDQPKTLHFRHIIKANSSCGPSQDCTLRVTFSCDASPDNRVLNINLRVWRHADGRLELLGAEELPPSSAFANSSHGIADESPYVLAVSDTETAKRHSPHFFLVRPVFIIAGASSTLLTLFIAVGALAHRRRRQALARVSISANGELLGEDAAVDEIPTA